ncbi:MAG: hypothetical protein U9R25_09290 [Chloroflexota bacterium]|nr:hypothetical protein [Chloroflexota bacterium]
MMNSQRRTIALVAFVLVAILVLAAVWLFIGRQPSAQNAQAPVAPSEPWTPSLPAELETPAQASPTAPMGPSPLASPSPTLGLQTPLSLEPSEQQSEADKALYLPSVGQGDSLGEVPSPADEPTREEPEDETEPTVRAAGVEPVETVKPMILADLPPLSLADWPRPVRDNGICIHNITEAYYHEENLDMQVRRLQEMGMRWTLMLYADENQIMKAAPRFRDAGIMVVWRKMLRPYERYYDWGRDIALLRELGMEPYMQIYNEPSLSAEWPDKRMDQEQFLKNLVNAVEQVYNAGGYVGLQFVSDEWLIAAIDEIQRRQGNAVFDRMFLVPHPYGLNHPPDYIEDANSVLGFLDQADVVRERLGFVPPMIAGEGGWKYNASDDNRFPRIDAPLHRDYHVAAYDWFRSGTLSNGEPLPDYLLAFCPWLLSSKLEDSAWFDSFAGDHQLTIDGVKGMSNFERRFSWE